MAIRRLLNVSLALMGLFCCYHLIVSSATAGVSRFLQFTSIVQSTMGPVDLAVRLTPSDPEAHYTRALELVNFERLEDAAAELQEATRLRPYHYYEWLDLGVTLDRLGNQTAAESALRESIHLAPYFAQPRWQLGNFLYRQGRFPEAYEQLRLGAASNPRLVPTMIELAWASSHGNVSTTELMVDPQGAHAELELANFLAKHGMGEDAVRHVAKAGTLVEKPDLDLARATIYELLSSGQFAAAYSAWSATHGKGDSSKSTEHFVNGDFAEAITSDDIGFGWQLTPAPNVTHSIDPNGPAQYLRSVRIEYSGDSPNATPIISELILLQPNTHYKLSFTARTNRLVSGGPPVIIITDVTTKVPKILGQSSPLPADTNDWTNYTVDFLTEANTHAVRVQLQRTSCQGTPCPIFGELWLSKFALDRN
jgi:hypothetical protein